MSINRALLFSRFEFNRFLLSKRGLIALVCYLLLWSFLLIEIVSRSADLLRSSAFTDVIYPLLGEAGFEKLIEWSAPELVFYWVVAMLSFPLLAVFASADQLCSDKARGTMRFLTLRATRFEILVGRFLGQVCISACFILLSIFAVLVLVIYNGESSLSASVMLCGKVFFHLLITVVPIIAFMTLINTFSTSSKQTIVYFFLIILLVYITIGLIETYLISNVGHALLILPNVNWTARLQLGLSEFGTWGIPIIQTVIFLAFAQVQFARSAL
ncbi:MAG: ABC transporter permease subunit [Pseudomonadota bacterium]